VKCFPNFHMTMAQHSLWDVCRSVSHNTDYVIRFDGRWLASLYKETDKNRIYRTASGLIDSGWFQVVRPRQKDQKTGKWLSALYRVLSAEEWSASHPHECGPVPRARMVQSQKPASPVPKNEKPVPRAGHSSEGYSEEDKEKRTEDDPSPTRGTGSHSSFKTMDSCPLTEQVLDLAKEVSKDASFSKKAKREIQQAIAEVGATAEEIAKIIPSRVELMDEFALRNCGSTLGAEIGSLVRTHRSATVKTHQEEKQLADAIAFSERQAQQRRAEIARQHRSEPEPIVHNPEDTFCACADCIEIAV
jgi:hypothetical protein